MPDYLLSTFDRVLRLRLDKQAKPRRIDTVTRGRGIYFGLARRFGEVFIAARNLHGPWGEPPRDPTGPTDAIERRGRWLLRERAPAIESPLLVDLHQIVWARGRLFATTGVPPFLIAMDVGSGGITEIPIAEAVPPDLIRESAPVPDLYHFNSICIDGDAMHVMAHNWDVPSFALTIDLAAALAGRVELRAVHRDIGQYAHDLLRHRGDLWALDSGGGALVRLGEPHARFALPEAYGEFFPRGLAPFGQDLLLAYGARSEERADRAEGPSRIVRFDPRTERYAEPSEVGRFGNTCVLTRF